MLIPTAMTKQNAIQLSVGSASILLLFVGDGPFLSVGQEHRGSAIKAHKQSSESTLSGSRSDRRPNSRDLSSGRLDDGAVDGSQSKVGRDGEARRGLLAESEPRFSFGLVADIQYAEAPPRGSRYYRASLKKLKEAVRVFNSNEVDRVIDVGDVIDRDPTSFDAVLAVYERLKMPLSIAVGNHDFPKSTEHTLNALGMDETYFAFDREDWRFIVLDGNDVSKIARDPGHKKNRRASRLLKRLEEAGAPNAKSWNGAIGQEQLAWFEGELNEAEKEGRAVIVFCHFPIYPHGAHTLWNRDEVIEVIDAHPNVVAWFNGHNHGGAYTEKHGVHYLTLPGMVETPNRNAFAIVDVHEAHLKIDGYGRVQDRILTTDRK